jgi:phosphoribosylformylglycinamidine synthase
METEYALELAGAKAQRMHINRIIEDKSLLAGFQIIVFPGGFSYGDDVAAGKILANQIRHHLYEAIQKFIDDGKLVLGICNGFQVLVKTGVLPGNNSANNQQKVTITYNDSGKFEDRWVYLAPQTNNCIFIESGRQIYLPVAHAEGKVVTKDEAAMEQLKSQGLIAFKYVDENGREGDYPINPNGSMDSIAGLTDTTGRILGLMPHPERFVRPTHHPHWSRLKAVARACSWHGLSDREHGQDAYATGWPCHPDGTTIFNNAVKYVQENF